MGEKHKNRWWPRLRIRHKIFLSIYLVLFPVLILAGFATYYQSYNRIMEENNRRYRAAVQTLDENIRYFEQDLTDILTYFCVDNGIIRVLSGDVAIDDRLFWTTRAPMEFVRSMLAIKSQITTLALYPENGFAPFYVSRDASVPILDVNAIRELEIYNKTIAAQGDIIWAKADVDDESLFTYNKSDKIVLCREIFDLTKKQKLGFLFLSVHVEWYNRMCANALLYENEAIAILGEDSAPVITQGAIEADMLSYLTENYPITIQDDNTIHRYGGNYIFSTRNKVNGKTIIYISPEKNWNQRIAGSLTTPILLAVVLLACMWPLSTLASRVISRPLNSLYNSMNRFKEGDFDQQITVTGDDEITELSETFNTMVRDIKELINRNYVMVLHERESELTALQAQINPHFLYNTLDSLYWQAMNVGQDKLAEDILSLSELFRLLLSSGQSEVSVERELSIVSHYLNVQKMRFSKKLDYCIDVSDDILDLPILKLVIQPFVENAIVHGLERRDVRGSVNVKGKLENNMICFTIEDNGTGMTNEQLKRALLPEEDTRYAKQRIGHYAIRNVKERLHLRYGERFKLEIESEESKGTTVYIEIPAQNGG